MAAKSLWRHLAAADPPFKFPPVSPWDDRYKPIPSSQMPKKWRACRKVRMEIACRKHRYYLGEGPRMPFYDYSSAKYPDREPPFDCEESRATLTRWIHRILESR